MKSLIFKSLFLITIGIIFSKCVKDEPKITDPIVPVNKGDFKWALNGGAMNNVADSSHYYFQTNTIYAFKNYASTSFELILSSFSVGSYNISSASGNQLTYCVGGSTEYIGAGKVNITANSNNNLSGDFNCSLSGPGSYTSVSGIFINVPMK